MITIKTPQEIEKIKQSCMIVAELLKELNTMIMPGIATRELDIFAEAYIVKRNAKPAFKGYRDYPATICASINEVIVHGIPGDRKLKEGDIISIDVGAVKDGYYGDISATFPVGKVEDKYLQLMNVTRESLFKGIEQVKTGNNIGDVSYAIQKHVEKYGYGVIRDFVGHGLGKNLHEEPKIPNYGEPRKGPKILNGMVMAIEPMVSMGAYEIEILSDGWTARTRDKSYAAHFEHTVAVMNNATIILTEI